MTQATNNQASWVGLGWDLPIGSIERRYKSCSDDGTTDSRAADLCWAGNNAVLSLNGQSGELIRDPTDASVWRLANDPGWKIDKISGASNGDDNGEYWRVTDQKGWRYYFGIGHDVRGDETDSVETVPVSGDDSGEPCYSTTASASFCDQAWRWNLDRVIDPHGTQMAIHWVLETNRYGKMGSTTSSAPYDRNAYPLSIEYAMDNSSTSVHRRQVTFTTAYRCAALDGSCPAPSTANDDDYPDTPLDLQCAAAPCTEHSPSFFSTRRLIAVTAQAYSGGWNTVDRWDLTQAFVDPDTSTTADDQEQALWLSAVQRTGAYSPSSGYGSAIALPSTFFFYQRYANRVDYDTSLGVLPVTLPRIDQVRSELDAVTDITYGRPDPCSKTALPAAASNTKDCFPHYSAPEGGSAGFGWYNKWLVTSTVDHDEASGDPDRPHAYTYAGGGAWHHDDNNFAPANQRSWSIWRGYTQVSVVDGATTSADSQTTVTRYFRGMHDDQDTSGQKSVSVSTTVSTPESFTDYNDLAGRVLQVEHTTLGGTDLSATVDQYWRHLTVDASGDERFDAYYTRVGQVDAFDYGAGGTTARHTQEVTDYDATYGYATDMQHEGNVSITSDDTCTTYTRFPDSSTWFVDYVQSERLYNLSCTGSLNAQTNTHYDNLAYGVSPTTGDPTSSITFVSASTSETTTSNFDGYGRVLSVDAPGRAEVDTDYHGAAFPGLVTTTTATPAIKSEVTLDPVRGAVLTQTSNSAQIGGVAPVTTLGYDPLGRLTGVWLPARSTGATANTIYAYQIGDTAQPMVTTRQLQSGTTYVEAYALLDSYGQPRETQVHAHTGNRTVTSTTYDDVGRVAVDQGAVFATGSPGVNVLNATLASTGSYVSHVYDAAGRVTQDRTGGAGVTHYVTNTSYGIASRTVTPPDQAATTTNYDGYGRISDILAVDESSGGVDGTIDYSYDARGELTDIDQSDVATGASDVYTTYAYDWLGRRISSIDPDAGETHTVYTDNLDNATVTTKVIRHVGQAVLSTAIASYDGAGRQFKAESVTGGVPTTQAQWNYPTTLATAALLASTDSADSSGTLQPTAYTYTSRGQVASVTLPTPGVSTTNPAATNAYPISMSYDEAGQPVSLTLPAVGVAPKETVTTGYDTLGFVNSLTSDITSPTTNYLSSSTYDTLGRLTARALGSPTNSTSRVDRTFNWDPVTRGLTDSKTTDTTRSSTGTDTAIIPSHVILAYNDADLHVVDETSPHNASMAERQCFSYDARGRLAQGWTRQQGGTCTDETNFKYGAAPFKNTYSFDALGRMTEARDLHGLVPSGGGTITTQTIDQIFGYHPDGVTKPAHGPDTVTGGAPGTLTAGYASDGTGKTSSLTQGTSPAVTRTLGYDWAQRLSAVTRSGTGGTTPGAPGTTATLSYNADNSLWRRVDASGTTYYLGADQIRVPAGGGTPLITRTYSAAGIGVAVRSTTATTSTAGAWITGDTQGSPALEVNWTNGSVTWRMQDPYGAPRNGRAVPSTPAAGAGTPVAFGDMTLAGYTTLPGQEGFLGKTEDPTSDLDLLGARSYDPTLGLFLQPDPLAKPNDIESLSGYLYAEANPVSYLDPTGLFARPLDTDVAPPTRHHCFGCGVLRNITHSRGAAVVAGAGNAALDAANAATTFTPSGGFGILPNYPAEINTWVKDEAYSVTGLGEAEDNHSGYEMGGYTAATVASLFVGGGDDSLIARATERLNRFFQRAASPAADTAADIPSVIYRGGGRSPSNLRLRPGEDALSFRDSLSNPMAPGRPVMNPGKDWIGIDTSKLPPGSVVPDGIPGSAVTPPGHVSVYVDDWELLKEAIIESGKFPK